jgi:hypothetical protein
MQLLKLFYDNKPELEAVKAFLIDCLKEQAVEKTFNGEDVSGIKDARENIERAFDKLDSIYGKIEVSKVSNSR